MLLLFNIVVVTLAPVVGKTTRNGFALLLYLVGTAPNDDVLGAVPNRKSHF